MIYISSFMLSANRVKNPNIYPYSVFKDKEIFPFVFNPITIFYGNNGSGKSTILNILAQKLQIEGYEEYAYTQSNIDRFVRECRVELGEDDYGNKLSVPRNSRYIKSEDILYEIKKIQQEEALENGFVYERMKHGLSREDAQAGWNWKTKEIIKFGQEKYSNGETAMQILMDGFETDALYILDEPEVSLSPANQVILSEEINKLSRLLNCQFIIATHSPFMLGTLNAKIYNIDDECMDEANWSQLDNVRYFYDFFKKHEFEFN